MRWVCVQFPGERGTFECHSVCSSVVSKHRGWVRREEGECSLYWPQPSCFLAKISCFLFFPPSGNISLDQMKYLTNRCWNTLVKAETVCPITSFWKQSKHLDTGRKKQFSVFVSSEKLRNSVFFFLGSNEMFCSRPRCYLFLVLSPLKKIRLFWVVAHLISLTSFFYNASKM